MSTAGPSRRKADARWARAWRTPVGTIALLAALPVLWSGVARLLCGDDIMFTAWRAGAGIADLIAAGQLWRLVTAPLLHVDGWHLAVNTAGILVFGQMSQRVFGAPRTWLTFFLTAWIATLASALVGQAWTLGSSGGVFGLIGSLVGLCLRAWREFPRQWSRSALAAATPWLIGAPAALLAVVGAGDRVAHLAGLISGIGLGMVLGVIPLGARLCPPGIRRALIGVAAVVGLSLAGVALLPVSFGAPRAIEIGPIVFRTPSHWIEGGAIQPCARTTTDGLRFVCATQFDRAAGEALGDLLTRLEAEADLRVQAPLSDALPDGWSGYRMEVGQRPDAAFRIYARRVPRAWWVVAIYSPARTLRGVPDVTHLLSSVAGS